MSNVIIRLKEEIIEGERVREREREREKQDIGGRGVKVVREIREIGNRDRKSDEGKIKRKKK